MHGHTRDTRMDEWTNGRMNACIEIGRPASPELEPDGRVLVRVAVGALALVAVTARGPHAGVFYFGVVPVEGFGLALCAELNGLPGDARVLVVRRLHHPRQQVVAHCARAVTAVAREALPWPLARREAWC